MLDTHVTASFGLPVIYPFVDAANFFLKVKPTPQQMVASKMDKLKISKLSNAIEMPIPMMENVVNIAHNKKIICSFFKLIPPTY